MSEVIYRERAGVPARAAAWGGGCDRVAYCKDRHCQQMYHPVAIAPGTDLVFAAGCKMLRLRFVWARRKKPQKVIGVPGAAACYMLTQHRAGVVSVDNIGLPSGLDFCGLILNL